MVNLTQAFLEEALKNDNSLKTAAEQIVKGKVLLKDVTSKWDHFH